MSFRVYTKNSQYTVGTLSLISEDVIPNTFNSVYISNSTGGDIIVLLAKGYEGQEMNIIKQGADDTIFIDGDYIVNSNNHELTTVNDMIRLVFLNGGWYKISSFTAP